MNSALAEQVAAVDALLPQTQCQRCGFAGCRPYAAAIVEAGTPINQCPPGGTALISRLAVLLGREALPLNPNNGRETAAMVVWIDPEVCIGCARCLPPCPVDAIIGAQRQLHTVIESWCTGCELCLPACPVDCMHIRPALGTPPEAEDNRQRYYAQLERRERVARERNEELTRLAALAPADLPDLP